MCDVTKLIWSLSPISTLISQPADFPIWLKNCVSSQEPSLFNIPTGTIFVYFIWSIWNARNKKIFEFAPIFPSAISKVALTHATEFFCIGQQHNSSSVIPSRVLIRWHPPEVGWLKLNIDGACHVLNHHIAAGGLIRDHLGNWIKGFQSFMGLGDSFLAELWGAFLGLKLANSINASHIWIETDCHNLFKLLTDEKSVDLHHFAPIINLCRCYLNHFSSFKITHVLREGNRTADALAGNALSSQTPITYFEYCPPHASAAFSGDYFGIHTPRGIG